MSRQQVHLSASSTFVCKASQISSVLYKFLHRNRGPYICCTQDGNDYHQRMSDDSKSSRISQVGGARRPISALSAFLSSASAEPVSFVVQPPPVIYVMPSFAARAPFDPSVCLRSSLDPSPPWDPSPAPSELPEFIPPDQLPIPDLPKAPMINPTPTHEPTPSPDVVPEINPLPPPDASPASVPEDPIPTIPMEVPFTSPPEVPPASTPTEIPTPLQHLDQGSQSQTVVICMSRGPPINPPNTPPIMPPGVPAPTPPPQAPPINPPRTPAPIPPPQIPPIPPGSPGPIPPPVDPPIPPGPHQPPYPSPEIPNPIPPLTPP
ncbi:hypothetical protein O6H91_04G116800 [Diphasiastrum complanatum]|nr:hypothetical protein O6H91_04G116800 [Diphasiastrum complanatum]